MDSQTPDGPMIDASTFGSQDSNFAHPTEFAGAPVVFFDPRKQGWTVEPNIAYRFDVFEAEIVDPTAKSSTWPPPSSFEDDLDEFLSQTRPATHFVMGAWIDPYEKDSAALVERICRDAANLPNLRAMYFGDIIQQECEISWIIQSDVSPLLSAFPRLEVFRVRGGMELGLSQNRHASLRCLAIETGGMNRETVTAVVNGEFPELEYLELWLGTDEYGLDATNDDLLPLLQGGRFPKLRYLGLRNYDQIDSLVPTLVKSPIVQQVETLDLSLGTLTDTGGAALSELSNSPSLKHLNLVYNYLSPEMVETLNKLPFTVDASDSQIGEDEDEDWRFVAVGE